MGRNRVASASTSSTSGPRPRFAAKTYAELVPVTVDLPITSTHLPAPLSRDRDLAAPAYERSFADPWEPNAIAVVVSDVRRLR